MKTVPCFILFLILILLLAVLVNPFIPGGYDPLSIPLATVVQLYSGIGLLTCVPAVLWFYKAIKYTKSNSGNYGSNKLRLFVKIYLWTNFFVMGLVVLMTTFGISRLLGIILFLILILVTALVLRRLTKPNPGFISSYCVPAGLIILPVLLLAIQLIIADPLTSRTREMAIKNCNELIDEIERFKTKYGMYPRTLNAIHKDYNPGIVGIERYYYTYDDSTYNIYFEQPRFFYDQFGTREFVVYNPKDMHLILSHTSWHMLIEPANLSRNQGWYASYDTGIPHWKYFWFD